MITLGTVERDHRDYDYVMVDTEQERQFLQLYDENSSGDLVFSHVCNQRGKHCFALYVMDEDGKGYRVEDEEEMRRVIKNNSEFIIRWKAFKKYGG